MARACFLRSSDTDGSRSSSSTRALASLNPNIFPNMPDILLRPVRARDVPLFGFPDDAFLGDRALVARLALVEPATESRVTRCGVDQFEYPALAPGARRWVVGFSWPDFFEAGDFHALFSARVRRDSRISASIWAGGAPSAMRLRAYSPSSGLSNTTSAVALLPTAASFWRL